MEGPHKNTELQRQDIPRDFKLYFSQIRNTLTRLIDSLIISTPV